MKKSLGPKTLVYPAPVFVVCSYDKKGKANAMTAAWGGICASTPPCVTVSIRKNRHSYESILERKSFTINIASESHAAEVDYFGMVSGRDTDKFLETGLTPVRSEHVDAPYIDEFPLVLECRLRDTLEIASHTQFIGEIADVKVDEAALGEEGIPRIQKVRPLLFAPDGSGYYGVGNFIAKAFSIGNDLRRNS